MLKSFYLKINCLLPILILFMGSCSTPASPPPIKKIIPIKETIIENLKRPWSMDFISENEVIVAEKDGDLLRVNLKTKEKFPIQGFPNDLADSIQMVKGKFENGIFPRDVDGYKTKYNAGIFEVLLDPDFEKNNWIYVSYASQNEEEKSTTKVIRAKLKNDALTQIEILFVATPYSHGLFHYGGGMTFGNDKKLYFTIGERLFNETLEPEIPIAQDLQDKRGKIYRLNPDGSIPFDNPNFGKNAVKGMYAVGIRAAQGITTHLQTGEIWFSEHGTMQGDEVNVLKKGANYGWPIHTTGKYRSKDYTPPKMEGVDFSIPIWFWRHTVAPTGLTFYTGDEFPFWKNNLIVPGLSRGSLWRFTIDGETVKSAEELFVDDRVRTRKAEMSPEGKLYILTDENNGRIIQIKNNIQ
ncbi:MAG: PQQ-dependent sugar dehydrogenase [Saprospiraceae bacterium]